MSTKKRYTSEDLFKEYGDLTFGKILQSFRLSDGLSQVEFAKKLNISPANLCDLEKGRKLPAPMRAIRIAKKLGLSEAFLVQVALQDMLKRDNIKFKISLAA